MYPTITIPKETTPTNVKINRSFSTFRSMIISGRDKPITAIMKASAVPRGTPFSINTLTIGMIPAAFEYKGTPINIDKGTEYQVDFPMRLAIKLSGT